MNKKLIRITEADLHRVVRGSVKKVLNEIGDTRKGQYALGQLGGRRLADGDAYGEIETAVHARDNRTNVSFK